MRMLGLFAAAAGIALVVGSPVFGQETALQYHERTDGQLTMLTPNGEVPVRTEHDALISVSALAEDSLHAWYDALEVASISPMGDQRPDASAVLGQLFVLRVGPRGHVEALRTPEFPGSFEGVTDLRFEFFDFFPARADQELALGLTWADTLSLEVRREMTQLTTKVSRYEVARDSVVDGHEVFVVVANAIVTIESSGPVPGQPGLSVRMSMSGPESNAYLVTKEDGRMLTRRRSADLKGTMEYVGAPQPVVFQVTQTYENAIDLVGGSDS